MIELKVKDCNNLFDSLKVFTEKTDLTTRKCGRCKTEIIEKEYFDYLPNTLIFHLDRTNKDKKWLEKYTFPIEEELDMSEYMAFQEEYKGEKKNYCIYKLVGITIH
jgi:hypothetical protein